MKRSTLMVTFILLIALTLGSCSSASVLVNRATTKLQSPIQAALLATPTPIPMTSSDGAGVLNAIQAGFSDVYTQVAPSVVNIQVVKTAQIDTSGLPGFPDFPFQMPDSGQPQTYQSSVLGSGFIWDQQGNIVTNNHVVTGADKITVIFSDGTSTDGTIVGADPASDLAVVKVDIASDRLHPVQLTDSTRVQVGQLVAAIGNPFGLEGTMTVGIVSALGRSLPVEEGAVQGATYAIPDVIQTDAPINPGNSGGVLVDIYGKLVGVTAAIESPVQANAGIGFVIPSIIAQRVVPSLIENGIYDHPWIGISGTDLNADLAEAMNLDHDQRGVLVITVVADSPADKAGLLASDQKVTINDQATLVGGDIITSIEGQIVKDFEDLTAYLARYTDAGQTVSLTILRSGKEKTIDLTLGVRPTEESVMSENTGGASLGIVGMTVTPQIVDAMKLSQDQQGVLVQQVLDGSPADEAGLRGSYKSVEINGQEILVGGDIIIALENQEISSLSDLQTVLQQYEPGQNIMLMVLRDGKKVELRVKLG
jgi:serine protease Do